MRYFVPNCCFISNIYTSCYTTKDKNILLSYKCYIAYCGSLYMVLILYTIYCGGLIPSVSNIYTIYCCIQLIIRIKCSFTSVSKPMVVLYKWFYVKYHLPWWFDKSFSNLPQLLCDGLRYIGFTDPNSGGGLIQVSQIQFHFW